MAHLETLRAESMVLEMGGGKVDVLARGGLGMRGSDGDVRGVDRGWDRGSGLCGGLCGRSGSEEEGWE